jgi:hypothetical protein
MGRIFWAICTVTGLIVVIGFVLRWFGYGG